MTARANSLTGRASVAARGVSVMLDGLRGLGYDVESLMEGAGVTAADLVHPDARVPCEAYGAIIGGALWQRCMPNLAVELARRTPLGAWPLLDYLVVTSSTVGAGLHQLARYMRLTGSPLTLVVGEDRTAARIELSAADPFAVEYEVVLLTKHLRDETGSRCAPADVSFRHEPEDVAALERVLGCRVRTKAPWNAVGFSRESWELPLRRRDPVLRTLLERHADDILARLPARGGLSGDVQRRLAAALDGGDLRVQAMARQLAVSPRTLQRRLAEEGASYQEILDAARRESAGRHLTESPLSIGEIAYLLGYSEPAAFHRAFRRWYGMTPEAFRHGRPDDRGY